MIFIVKMDKNIDKGGFMEKKCNCKSTCTCGCQEGKPCTCKETDNKKTCKKKCCKKSK